MEYFKKVKISLENYREKPVIVDSVAKSLQTLRKALQYKINPSILDKISKHSYLNMQEIDPDNLIIRENGRGERDSPMVRVRVTINEIINNYYDKFVINETGRLRKIDIPKTEIKKYIEEAEKELEVDVKTPVKTRMPSIK